MNYFPIFFVSLPSITFLSLVPEEALEFRAFLAIAYVDSVVCTGK